MDISPLIKTGVPIIQSYKNSTFKISGQTYTHDVVISADGVARWDGDFDALPPRDVLIWGTGDTQIWPDPALKARMPLEVMTTPAACRTYNALISEGRRVIAIVQVCSA